MGFVYFGCRSIIIFRLNKQIPLSDLEKKIDMDMLLGPRNKPVKKSKMATNMALELVWLLGEGGGVV